MTYTNTGSLQGSEEQGSGDLWCLTLLNIHSLQYKIVKWGQFSNIFMVERQPQNLIQVQMM